MRKQATQRRTAATRRDQLDVGALTRKKNTVPVSRREDLPKAAFQYGMKMSDGRKSRRAGPKLDRELKQSHRVTEKLKAGDSRKHKY